jgi:hypothetical protein
MKNLSCMSYLGKGNASIIAAGCQNIMLKIDIEKGIVTEEVHMAVETKPTIAHVF